MYFPVIYSTYSELHGLGTSGPQLAGDDDLTTLSARLHDEAQDTVACPPDGKTVEKLVPQRLALSDSGETTVGDLGGIEGDGVLGELEALLDERGELADAATLLTKNLLGVGGADDDVGDGGRDADLDARVTLLSELALEELVQLGVEDTICSAKMSAPVVQPPITSLIPPRSACSSGRQIPYAPRRANPSTHSTCARK